MSDKETAPSERFTNGKSRIATEKDVASTWDGLGFVCGMCGYKFRVGDSWRWQYANGKTPSYGNFLVCTGCDGPNVLERWNEAGAIAFAPNTDKMVLAVRALKAERIAVECTAPAPQPRYLGLSGSIKVFSDNAAATPQVTPCDHFWRTVAVNPKWSWFTECEKCKIGAPLELQAENYVEGTSEQASPTPDKCPACGSTSKNVYYAESNDASKRCDPIVGRYDSWHSSAATQKGTG